MTAQKMKTWKMWKFAMMTKRNTDGQQMPESWKNPSSLYKRQME